MVLLHYFLFCFSNIWISSTSIKYKLRKYMAHVEPTTIWGGKQLYTLLKVVLVVLFILAILQTSKYKQNPFRMFVLGTY